MRVATYNLDGFGGRDRSTDLTGQRIPALRAALTRLDADILCLQEVNAQIDRQRRGSARSLEALDRLLAGTGYENFHWCVSTGGPDTGPLDAHNLVILSRYRISEHRQFWHEMVPPAVHKPVTSDPPAAESVAHKFDRPIVHAVLEPEDGRALHVMNLHLRAPLAAFIAGQKKSAFVWKTARGWAEGFYLATLKRAGQALEARLAIDAILDADPDARIVVCGDLNADLSEMPARILRADADDTGNAELADRTLIPVERIAPEADRYSVIHAGHKHMLDHILVSRALSDACGKVEIHNTNLPDEVFDAAVSGDSWASDHAPLVLELNI